MMKFNVQELLHPFLFKILYSNHCIAPIHAPLPRHLTQKSHIITCHFIHIHMDFSLQRIGSKLPSIMRTL